MAIEDLAKRKTTVNDFWLSSAPDLGNSGAEDFSLMR
jgi:hypothetical protein